jgi:putative heme transporter
MRRQGARILRIGSAAVAVVVVVGVFAYAVPQVADYGSAWAVLTRLSWAQLALLLAATVASVVSCWPPLAIALPGLTLGQAAVCNQTTTSVANTVPGGGALAVGLTFAMYRSWGFPPAGIARSVLVTGIWNALVKLATPILAVAVLALTGNGGGALLLPALVGLAALAGAAALAGLLMWKAEFARQVGDRLGAAVTRLRELARRPPVTGWGEAAVRFRGQSTALLARRWLALTVTTAVNHLSLFLVFLLTVRLVGIGGAEVSWAAALGIFALARLLSAAPITPGGLGVVELTYIAGLVLAGGPQLRAEAVAAALLFRLLSYGVQIPLGGITYLVWQRRTSWRRPRRHQPATAGPALATLSA